MESLVPQHIRDLFKKTIDLLFLILSDLSTVNEIKTKSRLIELEETLQQLEVIWHDSQTDLIVMIDELLNLKSGLELFSDYLYRATKSKILGKFTIISTASIIFAQYGTILFLITK